MGPDSSGDEPRPDAPADAGAGEGPPAAPRPEEEARGEPDAAPPAEPGPAPGGEEAVAPPRPAPRRRLFAASGTLRRDAALSLLVLAVLAYTRMFFGVSVPNERSRIYLAVALVDHGTVSIDEPVRRWGPIYDWATREGRYYTDKAPGSSLLGAAAYGAARLVTSADAWTIDGLLRLMRLAVMLPVGLLGFLVLRRLLRRLGVGEPAVDAVSLAWILGSSAFHLSTAYLGHQIVAVALLAAVTLLLDAEALPAGAGRAAVALRLLGAGAAAGVAGITEYQSAIPCALVGLCAVAGPLRRRPLRLALFCAGAHPFAAALLAYNAAAFGGPFQLSYHFLVDKKLQELHGKGIGGVTVPQAAYAWGALFSLHRGIFSTSPLYLLVLPGLPLLWRRSRRLTLLVGLSFAYYLAFVSSTEIWYAGWGFGPRLLVPVMGLALLPIALVAERGAASLGVRALVLGFALFGVLYHQAVHVVFPEMPERMENPLFDLVLPAFRGDVLSPSLVSALTGAYGRATALPLAVVSLALGAYLAARLVRGLSLDAKLTVGLAALGVCLPLVTAIAAVGPSTSAEAQGNFVKWMKAMAAEERRQAGR